MVKVATNFVSSDSKIVKRFRRQKYGPVTIERTICLVLGPTTALYKSFLKHWLLSNKAMGTIFYRRDKALILAPLINVMLCYCLRRISDPPPPLWLKSELRQSLERSLPTGDRSKAYSVRCLYIFLINHFYHIRYFCNYFMVSPLCLWWAVGPRSLYVWLITNFQKCVLLIT